MFTINTRRGIINIAKVAQNNIKVTFEDGTEVTEKQDINLIVAKLFKHISCDDFKALVALKDFQEENS